MIRVLIVEDEPLAARGLQHMLMATGLVEVVGIAPDAGTALYLFGEEAPNAAFLDINLPGLDGMKLAAKMSLLPNPPLLVFTTGYADRAPEAFNLDAVHYLLKPITPAAVRKAVERVRLRLAKTDPPGPEGSPAPPAPITDERVPIRDAGGDVTLLVPPHSIVAAVRRQRRTWIHTADSEYATYFTLTELQAMLPEGGFMRVAREAIINVQGVEAVIHTGDRMYSIVLADRQRTKVEASRSGAKQIAGLVKTTRSAASLQ